MSHNPAKMVREGETGNRSWDWPGPCP